MSQSTGPIMPTTIEATQLLLLLNWMSPAFPVGTFAYSHGLEWVIDGGQVKTAEDVEEWIIDVITQGSGWNDAVLFSNTWAQDTAEVNELALALASSKERYLETTQLGAAFTIAASVFVPTALGEGEVAYPVAAAPPKTTQPLPAVPPAPAPPKHSTPLLAPPAAPLPLTAQPAEHGRTAPLRVRQDDPKALKTV